MRTLPLQWPFARVAAVAAAYVFTETTHCRAVVNTPPAEAQAVSAAGLKNFLEKQGANLQSIRVGQSSLDGGRLGIFATEKAQYMTTPGILGRLCGWVPILNTWTASATVASFPISSALTPTNILNTVEYAPSLRQMIHDLQLDDRIATVLFLIIESLKKRQSKYHHWMQLLPSQFETPLYWKEEELKWIRGTSLYKATEVRRKALEKQWRQIEPMLKSIVLEQGMDSASPTFEHFMWAQSIFWSRAIAFPCPDKSVGGVVMEEGIVPGLDFCNHKADARCRWTIFGSGRKRQGIPDSIRLVCNYGGRLPPLVSGEEVTINYGDDKSDEELLFLYGFCSAIGCSDNENNALMIPCPLESPQTWDVAMQDRIALLRKRAQTPQIFLPKLFLEKAKGSMLKKKKKKNEPISGTDLPPGVMSVIEVFVMDPIDVKAELENSVSPPHSGPHACTERNDVKGKTAIEESGLRLAVLTTVMRLIELQIAELEGEETGTGSLEQDEMVVKAGGLSSSRHGYALAYRMGQKRLARDYLEYISQLLNREMAYIQTLTSA